MLRFGKSVKQEAQEVLHDEPGLAHTRAVNRASVWLVGDQLSRAHVRGHEFACDEPIERGGGDEAPAPLEYLLASLGFCQEVMIARNAALRELRLEDARIDVRGYFDRRGGHVPGVNNRGFEEIRLDIRFESPEDADTIIELMRVVDEQCYALNTLRRAAVIKQTISLNGEVIRQLSYGGDDGQP